jgi:exodeoxyribonuclease-3
MRITTWNVNGLRAALGRGFERHIKRLAPDVVMLQEIRCNPEQLEPRVANPRTWNVAWHPAEKKGYAGTAVWAKQPVSVVSTGADAFDDQGRVLHCRVGGVHVVSTYLPSGSSGEAAQARKDHWLDQFMPYALRLAALPEPVIIGGDINIAHTENDIHNPTANKRNSGFLPHERKWFGELLASGWTDAIREVAGDVKGPYSWWSNRGRARELDRGWRLDYLLLNKAAAARMTGAFVTRKGGLEVSDHAPVTVELAD